MSDEWFEDWVARAEEDYLLASWHGRALQDLRAQVRQLAALDPE